MKHAIAAAGACFALAASHSHAQTNVVVYGVLDVGMDYGKAGSFSQVRQLSGGLVGSRLGFRGTEDLGGGLSAVFRLESGINADTGTFAQGGRAFGREATLGLSSKDWGTIRLGRMGSTFYVASLSVNAFQAGQSGSVSAITRSTATSDKYPLHLIAAARSDNAVHYTSPSWGGVQLQLHGSAGEKSTTQGSMVGATLQYNARPWNVLVSVAKQRGAGSTDRVGAARGLMVGGSYDAGFAKVFAGYTREKNDCLTCTGVLERMEGLTARGAGDFTLLNLGVRAPVGAWTLIGEVFYLRDRSDYAAPVGNRDVPWLALGAEYALSKRTTLWGSVGAVRNRNGSQYVLSTGPAPRPANAVPAGNPTAKNIGIGITHAF